MDFAQNQLCRACWLAPGCRACWLTPGSAAEPAPAPAAQTVDAFDEDWLVVPGADEPLADRAALGDDDAPRVVSPQQLAAIRAKMNEKMAALRK